MIDDETIIGKICLRASCLVFFAPIQVICRVTKSNNYNLNPIYLSYTSLFSSRFWMILGIVKKIYIYYFLM